MMMAARKARPRAQRTLNLTAVKLFDKPAGVRRLVEMNQACRYAGVSRTRMYQLIKEGKVTAYKDGNKTLIDLNTIDAYHNSLPLAVLR